KLQKDRSAEGRARLAYFWLNKGPWSDLDEHAAFLPGVPARKPPGSNYYPESLSKEEFEAWLSQIDPPMKEKAQSFFTVIRREKGGLKIVPYSVEYAAELKPLAALLRKAAEATPNATLRKFLRLRADAFLSDDYYASDVAWMQLDSPVDVTIGPYETYTDELFGFKAAFEAYVCLRDDAETGKLKFFAAHLQDIENHLPIDPRHRNPKLGALTPITVVNQIRPAGDGAHGIATAAFNLPNDDKVVTEMGAKRVMLKNVQEAKFRHILTPIARRVLSAADQQELSFDAFFTHILAHELSHGLGPQKNVRQSLKNYYGTLEEAKADITGLFLLQYLYDRKLLPEAEVQLYTTFLASMFRTLRFGIHEAHGRGMAIQFNYLLDAGAIRTRAGGAFALDLAKTKEAVTGLAREIMTIQAEGDFEGARRMVERLAVIRPELAKSLERLTDLPVDITPRYSEP
ncbi:MAG: hypothetical protein FJW39_33625, partial [Acidobacteria bacterium]|nr:hypothetical protein [Acidobacteriota bacterium]